MVHFTMKQLPAFARVLFCEHEGKMVLLHAFIKKTQKTPASDLELAIRRKKEIV